MSRAVSVVVEGLEGRRLLSSTLTPTADADVENLASDSSAANANFGADTQLRISADANDTIETYLTFDISGVTSVGAATVSLTGGLNSFSDPQNNVSIFAVPATTWVEGNGVQPSGGGSYNLDDNPPGEVRWNNRPSSSGVALDTQTIVVPQVYQFDVTSYLQAQKAAGATKVSFVLRGSTGGGEVIFSSRESTDQPTLTVDDDLVAPTAAVNASNVTTAGGTTGSLTVTYSDNAGIDPSTIDIGDIQIAGPGGNLTITGVSVNATDPKAVQVTYNFTPRGGSWDAGDNSTYTVTVLSGQVTDFGNNEATGSGSFQVAIPNDTTPPVASSFNAQNVTASGSAIYTFTISYTDNVALNASTIGTSDVTVTRNGDNLPMSVTGVTKSGTGNAINATYTVSAPGGTFDVSDNGTYTITVLANSVQDAAGNNIAQTTHTFNVAVPDTNSPGVAITPVAPITTAGVTTTNITVTYSDNQGIDASTIDSGDVSVVQDGGGPLAVTLLSKTPSTNSTSIVAVYSVTAPGGFWNNADNGSYTISIAAGAVKDTSNNSTPLAGASFEVNIPSGTPIADPSFNGGNPVSTGFVAEAMATDSLGRVIVAGRQGDRTAGSSQSVLQRLNPDGSLDTFFGEGGQIIANPGDNDGFFAVAVDVKQRIVAAGFRGGELEVVRYDSKGRIDKHFGQRGIALADLGGTDDTGYAITTFADGSVLVGGTGNSSFALARFNSKGRIDTHFGVGGVKTVKPDANACAIGALAIAADGGIIAAGTQGTSVVLLRMDGSGNLVGTFGTAGVLAVPGLAVRTDLGSQDHTVGLAVLPSGIIAVGNGTTDGDFGVREFNADGSNFTGFGSSGLATVDFGGEDDLDFIGLQGTGQLILAGTTDAGAGIRLAVAALKSNGTLDATFSGGGKFTVENAVIGATGATPLHVAGSMQNNGRLLVAVADGNAGATSSPLRRLIPPGSGVAGVFGTVNGKNTKLSFIDADGKKISGSLKGGTATALYDGNVLDFVLTGTTDKSSLGLSAKGGDKRITIRDLRSDGPMKAISAKTGDFTGTISIAGAVSKISIGTLTGTMAIAGSISSLSVAGNVAGAFILAGVSTGSDGHIGGGNDSYDVGKITKLSVGGSMSATFVGAGVNPVNGTFGDNDDTVVGGASSAILSISVKKGLDNSTVFASGLFAKAKIPQKVVPTLDPHFRVLT
jgi:uncharacterized delta-60 repeat protein